MKKCTTIKSELICTFCGNIMPIIRPKKHQRNLFHIKDLYCYKCDKVTKYVELKDKDILKKELEYKEDRTEQEQLIYNLLINNKKIEEEKVKKLFII